MSDQMPTSDLQNSYMYPHGFNNVNNGGLGSQGSTNLDQYFHPDSPVQRQQVEPSRGYTQPLLQRPQPQLQLPKQQPMTADQLQSQLQNKAYQYNSQNITISFSELMKRALKYLVEGLAVAFVTYLIAKDTLSFRKIMIIAITAAAVFAILDTVSPTIAYGSRFGAGFMMGSGLVGMGTAVASPVSMLTPVLT